MPRKNQGDYTEPDKPDFYCPVIRGEVQKLEIHMATGVSFPNARAHVLL